MSPPGPGRAAATQPTRIVVLLEGVSDVAAVRAVAQLHAVDLAAVTLVDLHGVTNVHRVLTRTHRDTPDAEILGLCDIGEVRFVRRALEGIGRPVRDVTDLPAYGFFVCRADLEDELIRALGTARTIDVIERIGLGPKLAGLRRQPAWLDRPLEQQLHRFCGVASGRKELLAGELAGALTPDQVPEPLRMLLERIEQARP